MATSWNFLESSLKNLNYTKFIKEITWIYQLHPKKKKGNTKKHVLQFFPTNKETKERNVLIRNKVGIENVEIRVIKYNNWNDNKKERKWMIFVTTTNWFAKKSKIIAIVKPKRT